MNKMKNLCLLLFLAMSTLSFAQKVTYKEPLVFKDGQPYCKIEKKGSMLERSFMVKTLSDKEVMFWQVSGEHPDGYYKVLFSESAQILDINFDQAPSAKSLAELLVSYDAITQNGFNAASFDKFRLIVRSKSSSAQSNDSPQSPKISSEEDYKLVSRDYSKKISESFGEITQGFEKIGTVKVKDEGSNTVYTFYLPNGTKVASCEFAGIGSKSVSIYTYRDKKTHQLSMWSGEIGIEEKLAEFLVSNGYL
jgi:hypothetical protein